LHQESLNRTVILMYGICPEATRPGKAPQPDRIVPALQMVQSLKGTAAADRQFTDAFVNLFIDLFNILLLIK